MEKQNKSRKNARPRRAFTPQYKDEAVRLCQVGDRTVTQVAADLDLTETALRAWVQLAARAAETPLLKALADAARLVFVLSGPLPLRSA